VIARNGILGSGAGTGSQGAQHFGGGSNIVGSAAEGGLGKVLAELGVPGLLLLLWLVISFARYIWSIILYVTRERDVDPSLAKLVFGLVAFLMTNAFVYTIAHQAYGDPFVLIILGFFLGFVMATPKMVTRNANDRRRATSERRLTADDRAESDDRRGTTGDRRRTTGDGTPFPVSGRQSPVPGFRSSVVGRPSTVQKQ